jgi:HSP20 family molecular chaperone IbpA
VRPRAPLDNNKLDNTKQKSFKPYFTGSRVPRKPFADVNLIGDEVRLTIELPGVEEANIRLDVHKQDVEIKTDNGGIQYQGSIYLPTPVNPEIHNFEYKNGILTFTLERRP